MDQPYSGEARRYVTFQISGRYFALPLECIREMMPMQPLTPWFRGGNTVLGVLQCRGRGIVILDLRTHLDLGPRNTSRQERLVIVRTEEGFEFGFAADKITDSIKVHPGDIRESTITGHGRPRAIPDLASLACQERTMLEAALASNSISSS